MTQYFTEEIGRRIAKVYSGKSIDTTGVPRITAEVVYPTFVVLRMDIVDANNSEVLVHLGEATLSEGWCVDLRDLENVFYIKPVIKVSGECPACGARVNVDTDF